MSLESGYTVTVPIAYLVRHDADAGRVFVDQNMVWAPMWAPGKYIRRV